MAGNQGHRSEWISTVALYWMPEEPAFAAAQNGYQAAGDTVIGNDVRIGSEAIVMPGIRIGDSAVIGTRALVTRDVEPYAIIGGNPAKTIRKRFDDRRIEMLVEMQWWNWSSEQLKAVMPLMTSAISRRCLNIGRSTSAPTDHWPRSQRALQCQWASWRIEQSHQNGQKQKRGSPFGEPLLDRPAERILFGRRDWTRTNDPHHVKVVL